MTARPERPVPSPPLFWLLFSGALLFFMAGFPDTPEALLQVNRVLLVDNFDDQNDTNLLGGEIRGSGGFEAKKGFRFLTGGAAFGKSGASLALDYDVSEPGSLFYYWSPLTASAPVPIKEEVPDLTEMRYFSFWMKDGGNSGGRPVEFFVELQEDTDRDGRFVFGKDTAEKLPVSRFSTRQNSGGWQKVVVPLTRFRRIQHWDRVLQVNFVLENRWHLGRGSLYLDDLLFGSNYPEEFHGKEIPMQNRVSSFKIDNQISSLNMRLKSKTVPLTLTLTFVDSYLEEIRFEESRDEGSSWQRMQSFYDHSRGGVYEGEARWKGTLDSSTKKRGLLVRVVGLSLLGGETHLAGPYRIRFE